MEKYALITGASGGIGKAVAKRLAREGYSLYLHYFRNKKSIEDLKNELEEQKTTMVAVQADLSVPAGANDLVSQIRHDLDCIIHNSGTSSFGLITDMNSDEINSMVQLHVTSPFVLTKELVKPMISRKKGNIIVVSSIWGQTGASCEVLYSMVKGGQISFVKALAKELAPSGIRVNGIAPGAIATGMMERFAPEDIAGVEEEIPMGRLGTPREVADAASFLASDQSSYVTGQILSVNGGWLC